jgi:carboxyl-terminal processing protease
MPRNNIFIYPGALPFLSLIAIFFIMSAPAPVLAAPPVDEIYTIMVLKALRLPSRDSLATLNDKHLGKRLLAIDPYARYVPPASSSKESSHSLRLGVEVFANKSRLWIQPVPGGPADRAGLPEFAVLLAINGVKVQGSTLDRISALLDKAVQKEQVIITVSATPGAKGKEYKVRPAQYKSPSITWRRTGNDIVLRIIEFEAHYSAPALSARFATLVRPGTRVVLDLRGCSGGDLYEALEIAGMFVPAGLPLASTYDRTGVVNTYRSPAGQKLKCPDWIIIDNRSASAAEILAGILQYHHLTRVVGERSYGKCLSQTLFPLSDGGGLWLTTLDVRFPDNRSCAGSGIKPDIPFPDISVTRQAEIIGEMAKRSLKSK